MPLRALGVDSFEEVTAGTPAFARRVTDGIQGTKLGVEQHATQLGVELGVATGFTTNGAGGTADMAGRLIETAPTGDEVEYLVDFDVGERARTSWPRLRGRRRRGELCHCRDLEWRAGGWSEHEWRGV